MAPPAAALALALYAAAAPAPAPFVVAIDPGHGGSNTGAATLVPGLYEKHVTLALAQRVRARLAGEPNLRVVLCRSRDAMVPLRARVRCANEARADLFLSLHANSSPFGPKRGSQRGFEMYLLPAGDLDRDVAAAALGAPDDAAAAWAGHEVQAASVTAVEASRRIAWRLGDALGAEQDRGLKQQGAMLDVLQGVRVPGLLLEVGFLDHPVEGRSLVRPEGREVIAEAIAKAMTDLRARKLRGRGDVAITAPPGEARPLETRPAPAR